MADGEWIISQVKPQSAQAHDARIYYFYDSFFTYLCGGSAKRDIYGQQILLEPLSLNNRNVILGLQLKEVQFYNDLFCMGKTVIETLGEIMIFWQ